MSTHLKLELYLYVLLSHPCNGWKWTWKYTLATQEFCLSVSNLVWKVSDDAAGPYLNSLLKQYINRFFSLQPSSVCWQFTSEGFSQCIKLWSLHCIILKQKRVWQQKKLSCRKRTSVQSVQQYFLNIIFWYLRQFEQMISFPMTQLLLLLILL